jgi:2-methylcitrate dehydratase PrpD
MANAATDTAVETAASLTEGLVEILARPVDSATRARAGLHLLDWIGCAIAGAASDVGRIVAGYGRTLGRGSAKAIGAGRREAGAAALINGCFGNVLEMDDIHRTSILHPGPVVIPAALAVAERDDSASATLLDGIVRGYEAVIRIGRSFGPGHYRHWHNTSTGGPFGAAAAVGSILGLDYTQMVAALGNAGTQASGPWQCRLEGAMSKQLHTGRASASGLAAADLAQRGFTGPRLILEGPLGWYAAACPDARPERVLADPDDPWLIGETSFKPWPACRHAHPAIDAALKLRNCLHRDVIDRLEVCSYADAIGICDNATPRTSLEAKFSLQHSVAAVVLDGPPQLTAFNPPALSRPDIVALRQRVVLRATERFTSAYPQHYGASVTARLHDGRSFTAEAADALGDPENPISATQVVEKASALMASASLKPTRIRAISAAAEALAEGGALRDLTRLLP